jgi:hypothetical protein
LGNQSEVKILRESEGYLKTFVYGEVVKEHSKLRRGGVTVLDGATYVVVKEEKPDSCMGCDVPHQGNLRCSAGGCLTSPYNNILKLHSGDLGSGI